MRRMWRKRSRKGDNISLWPLGLEKAYIHTFIYMYILDTYPHPFLAIWSNTIPVIFYSDSLIPFIVLSRPPICKYWRACFLRMSRFRIWHNIFHSITIQLIHWSLIMVMVRDLLSKNGLNHFMFPRLTYMTHIAIECYTPDSLWSVRCRRQKVHHYYAIILNKLLIMVYFVI